MRDFFTFADIIKTSTLDPSYVFLCSFDVSSFSTYVPLAETIQICPDALYSSEHHLAPFPRQIFVELMEMATSSVEFIFSGIMHCQIDGVAMGSSLGPALAKVFVGYYKSQVFHTTSKPEMYRLYVDDTFVAEVESRTQGSRPRPRPKAQKQTEAKDSLSKDRHSRGQGQDCSRPRPKTKGTSASALQKKKKTSSQKFFKRSPQKHVFQKIFQALHKILTIQKIVLSSSRRQANFRGLETSRPRPRT